MKRAILLGSILTLAGCAQRTVTIAVEVDGAPEHGPHAATVEAARPAFEKCVADDARSSTAITVDVDAAGHVRVPFMDHPMPAVACVRDVLSGLTFAAGSPRAVLVRVVHATEAERASR
jgi:hypothetical protein